jgi:alpha-beta hydrolase superfamily lysophospholipase
MPAARTHVRGAGTIPAPGVEQTIRFLDGPGGEIFCSLHAPTAGAQASMIMCPPLLADHAFSYRRELLLAVELARRGVAVWRFHYAGTGYSEGAPDTLSLDSMVADARLVVDTATSASSAPVTVAGTRCGALVAAAAAGPRPLVLWEAITDGSDYLREGFRARMIVDGGQLQRRPPTSAELLDELRRAGRIELVGYSLYRRLHDELAGLRLSDLVSPRSGRILLINSRTADGAEPSDAAAQGLRGLGLDVTTATVGIAEGWWFHRTQQSDHEAVASDLAAVISPWLKRSETPAAVQPAADNGRRDSDFLDYGAGDVFGLLTPPTGTPRREAALLLWGGGGIPAFGRNRVASALTRRLSESGYHVLQLDYPGRGESPGSEPADPIDEPAKLEVFAAARAAYEWLASRGLTRVVTIGTCQGGVAALNTADAAPTLTGLALLAPNIAERGDESVDGDPHPMHPRIRNSFQAVVLAGTPLLLAYGIHDEGFNTFKAAADGELGAILRPAGEHLAVTFTEERIHGWMTVSGQESTIDLVMEWLVRLGR